MAVKINFNEASAQTHTALIRNERLMNKSLLRLSTGVRILNAADDSAGLFIADMLSTVAKAYDQGNRNIQTGISALQIAEASAGQIFDKLQEIYVRAQNAANDVNDPNARLALQQEIRNFVDAIQKIGTDTEYNGIKLLNGNFTNKYIHYGPRMDQTLSIDITDIRSQSVGAHMVSTLGNVRFTQGQTISDGAFSANNLNFTSIQTMSLAGRVIYTTIRNGNRFILDAGYVAEQINFQLRDVGFEAKATNVSVANRYNSIADVTGTANLIFYVGDKRFTITGVETTITLDRLVEKINRAAATAGADLSASVSDGRLVLTSSKGYTIGVDVTNLSTEGNINLDQIIQGAQRVQNTTTGAAIKVGTLHIARDNAFQIQNFAVGLGERTIGTGTTTISSQFKNLYSIDVTTNEKSRLTGYITSSTLLGTSTVGYSTTDASYLAFLTSQDNNFFISQDDLGSGTTGISVAGQFLRNTGLQVGAVDAAAIARAINSNTTLRDMGIRATATNSSTADNQWQNIQLGAQDVLTIRIYLGQQYASPNITVSYSDATLTLNTLVNDLRGLAGGSGLIVTSTTDNRLVLSTANGETIGIEISLTSDDQTLSVDLSQFLQGAQGAVYGGGTGVAIRVGQLQITGQGPFAYNFTGASAQNAGLGISPASGDGSTNLGALQVNQTSYTVEIYGGEAELAMLITSKALQTVDTVRAQIGATMNNLQSIFDSQKVAYDNTKEAESVIRNTDYAKEMAEFTTLQIRMQATVAMLAQANTLPQLVLQLLR